MSPAETSSFERIAAAVEPTGYEIGRLRVGSDTWLVREPEGRRLVLQRGSPNWFGLRGDPRANLVKVGVNREVWRVDSADGSVFVKRLHPPGWTRRMGTLFRRRPAYAEWRCMVAAEARGVPTVRALAYGASGGGEREEVVLSAGAPGAVSLAEWWATRTGRPIREHRTVILQVADLVATAHARGFVHRDGHPGNILLGSSPGGTQSALFADLHGARWVRTPMSARAAAKTIAHLDQYFCRKATRADRLRFLKTYLSHRHGTTVGMTRRTQVDWIHRIRAKARAVSARLAAQRDRRMYRSGTYFFGMRPAPGWRGRVVLKLERRHAFPEPAVPDHTVADWKPILAQLLQGDAAYSEQCGVSAARRRPKTWRTCLLWTVCGSAARRQFCDCHRRRHRDLDAPLALGYMECRSFGVVRECVLMWPTETGCWSGHRDPEDGVEPV